MEPTVIGLISAGALAVINEQVRREKPRCDLNVKQHQLLWVISLMLACKRFGPKVFGERYFSGIVVVVRFQQTK